jgi:hypothetical protein
MLKLLERGVAGSFLGEKPLSAFRNVGQSGGMKSTLDDIKVLRAKKLSYFKIFIIMAEVVSKKLFAIYIPKGIADFIRRILK